MQKEVLPNDETEYDICTNYRYMRRKNELQALMNKKDESLAQADGEDKKKKTAKKGPQIK